MDGSRFDDLTRALSASDSRRRVLIGLVGGALGVLGLRSTDARTCTAPGTICREHSSCCSGTCNPPDRKGRRRCACLVPDDCQVARQECRVVSCTAGVCGTADSDGAGCTGGACRDGACVVVPGKCFWLNSQTSEWGDPRNPYPTYVACKAQDSCFSGGGRQSGGGCYKWTVNASDAFTAWPV